jgi:hypothetical protein
VLLSVEEEDDVVGEGEVSSSQGEVEVENDMEVVEGERARWVLVSFGT